MPSSRRAAADFDPGGWPENKRWEEQQNEDKGPDISVYLSDDSSGRCSPA